MPTRDPKDKVIPFPSPKDPQGQDDFEGFETVDLPTLRDRIWRLYDGAAVSLDFTGLSPDARSHAQLAFVALLAAGIHINAALGLPPRSFADADDDRKPTPREAGFNLTVFRERVADLDPLVFDRGDISPASLTHSWLGSTALSTTRIHLDMAIRSQASSR